jgi:hypothetical protein
MRKIYYNPINHMFHGFDGEKWWMGCDFYGDAHTVNCSIPAPPIWILDQLKEVDHCNLGDYAAQKAKWKYCGLNAMWKVLWWHHPGIKGFGISADWT